MHNYGVVSSTGQKRINWNTLNRKVFTKLNMKLSDQTLNQVVDCKPGAIEQVNEIVDNKLHSIQITLVL